MKQFTRRNSQQQHDLGSHTQKVKETNTFRLVENTSKGSFPTSSDDPYSFKGDSQEPADIVQARQTAPQQVKGIEYAYAKAGMSRMTDSAGFPAGSQHNQLQVEGIM